MSSGRGRRIHAAFPAPAQTGPGDDLRDRVKHPVRTIGGGDPFAPVHQRGRIERDLRQRPPARHLPPDVEAQRVRGLRVGQIEELLEHQHRPDQIRRQRRPPPRRAEQVSDERIRKQLMAVLSQEREHAARRHQLPDQRLRVQQLPIRPRNPLHHNIITRHTARSRQTPPALNELFRGFLERPVIQRCQLHKIRINRPSWPGSRRQVGRAVAA